MTLTQSHRRKVFFQTSILALLFFLLLSVPTISGFANTATAAKCDASQPDCEATTPATQVATDAVQLPAADLEKVKEHHVKLRYFKAIGFLDKSKRERDAIFSIYEQHGLAVPKEFQQ